MLTPKSLKGEAEQGEFAGHGADVAVVVAYGLLLPQAVLDAPREGCLNLHGSALPRWRGAAPIQRAVMAGDAETAVMVMRMEAGLDTGPVCLAERLAIGPDETTGELHDRMSVARRWSDGAGAGSMERGSLDRYAATRGGRHLRGQDRQGRSADGLRAVRSGGSQPDPRALALSRRLFRGQPRRQDRADQSAAVVSRGRGR